MCVLGKGPERVASGFLRRSEVEEGRGVKLPLYICFKNAMDFIQSLGGGTFIGSIGLLTRTTDVLYS